MPILSLLAACGGDAGGAADTSDAGTGAVCERDDVDGPEQAVDLEGGAATGVLCPVGDVDWYRFSTGPEDHLLHVTLAMDGELSPVEPAYVVSAVGTDGLPTTTVAATPPERIGTPLDERHCLAPGTYLIAVKDDGDDGEDFRRTYALTVETAPDPDPAEPNDDAATAATLAVDTPTAGVIACAGDADWYGFDAAPGQLVQLRLTAPVAGFQPTLRLVDGGGVPLVTKQNLSGASQATDLIVETVVPASGRYYAAVADDDGRDADPDVDYTLTLSLADDTDPNEPNGHPDAATALTASACADGWSDWREVTGNVGAPGDNDWFRLPLSGCDGPQGILEAEVELDEAGLSNAERWALAEELQLALTVVRPHAGSPCSEDLTCQALTHPCGNDWDCSGLFNTCRPDGFCAGSGVCLPEGRCGANVIQRRFNPPATPADPSAAPPPDNRAIVSTPLFGDAVVYLRVADYQSDGADRGVSYRLRARVRSEPDLNEPDNVYAPTLLADFPAGIQTAAARSIPVHDCTVDEVEHPVADCCGPDTWIEGALSYENDLDFYRYDHPCPGEDCNLRVVYELDGGPVDFVLSVYRGSSLWFGGVVGASAEAPSQLAQSGAWGGSSSCYYAFAGHEGEPYRYHLAVRDLADTRDWDPDQRYRFCVERVSRACDAPCVVYEDGCGAP